MEDQLTKDQKYNINLFPVYKMFSWDLLFYYSVIFLFLTQAKGLSASTILFGDAFYPISKFLFQIICITYVDKYGKQQSLILGNLLCALSILIIIVFNGLNALIICNIIMAIGYNLKELCETSILYSIIPTSEKQRKICSNIDGKGTSLWYAFDSITSIASGFLFVFNPYLPIFFCFLMYVISAIIVSRFKNIPEEKNTKNKTTYFKDLRIAFKYIFKSNRLKALLLFSGLFYGLLSILGTLRNDLLTEYNVPEQYFGIIFAVLGVVSAISAKSYNWFHHRYRNKTLSVFSLVTSFSLILLGIIGFINLNYNITIISILIIFVLQYFLKAPYYVLIARYLHSFSSDTMSTKIFSANILIQSIFRVITSFVASFVLGLINLQYTFIILGCIFTLLFILLLDYMKTRVGLKPEQYKKEDIYLYETK